jgi:hypothetical protein
MSDKRTLLKLDDQLFEVVSGSEKLDRSGASTSGIQMKRLDDDDTFNAAVLEDGFEKMLNNDFNRLANEAYSDICKSLKNGLRKTAMNALGFESDYGQGWRVDHCNGRISVVSEHISSNVKRLLIEEFDKLFAAERESILQEARPVVLKEFRTKFLEHCRYEIRSVATRAATTFLENLVQEQMEELKEEATLQAKAALMGIKLPPNK